MKRNLILSMLALAGSLSAGPVDDAVALLQSRKYPEAAAALAGVPLEARGPGEVAYLRALSLHLAGKSDEAVAAAGQVPGDSAWGMKARFLTAAAHTKAKRHKEAEAIYAAAAAEAFDQARRDGLVQSLLEFAGEAINPVAAGELTPPKPDWKKAAVLYDKVLDLPVTAELRSEVLLRKARLHAVAGDEAAAEGTFNAWLLFSDPGWTLPLGAGKQNVEAKVTGKARAEARLRLAGSLVAQHRALEARAVADDLLALLAGLPEGDPDKAMAGDARWLKVRTYSEETVAQPQQMPMQQRAQVMQGDQGEAGPLGSPHQQFVTMVPFPRRAGVVTYVPDEYLAALRGFLKDFPGHGSAPLAAEAVARTLDRLDRDAEAVAAWGDFIGAKVYQFDGAAAASRVPDRVTGVTPAEDLLRRQQAGAFRVGQRHFEKRRYAEAIAQWQGYIAAYHNGAEWPRAQSGIVDAEFQSGLEAVASGDEKRARELFDAFLVRYPLEARARQILFIYGQFRYAAAQAMKEQKHPETAAEFQKAIEEWTRLTGKYPETEEASLALYNTALILSDELGRLEDGLAAFKRLTWGKWADPAKRRVDLMSSKSLAVASERVFRLSETPAVKISVRNIEKVKVSRYPLDVEAFFRSRHRMDAIDLLDIDLIAPEKTWEVAVQDYARYRSLQQDIPVEFAAGQSGACIVRVEAEDWQATTLVVRSDIDVVVETARREVLAFVTSGADKKPVSGAAVLLSDGEKIMASGQTGADGVFRAKPEGIETAETVRVLVSSAQGMAGSYLSMSGLGLSTAADKMSRVVFDRGSYGAGGVVQWVAMRREVREGAFPVMAAGEGWKWRAQLPDGRLLYEGAAVWDELGLCRGSFTLPPSAFDGEYKVRIFNEKESVQGGFTVAEEAAGAALGIRGVMERPRYLAGETAKGYFVLEWANGLPASGEPVSLVLPDGREENRTSDANGVVVFESPAVVAGQFTVLLRPTGRQALPNQEGGAIGGMARYSVSADEFGLAFGVMPEVVLAGEAFEMKLRARRYDERGWAGAVKLTVARRGAVVPSRVLEGVPWISAPVREAKDEVILDGEVVIGESGEAAQALALPQPGNYVLKLSGKDRQGHEIKAETMLRAVGGEEDAVLRVGGPAEPLVAGQMLKLRIQSGFAHPNALVTVHAQEFFSHQLVALKAGANELEIPVLAVHAPNFRVTVAAVEGRQVHVASRPFEVRSGLRLELAEDGNGYVVRTTDLAGRPVAAAVVSHAWASGGAGGLTALPRVVVPTRATGLSLDSSVAFFHTGITVRKTEEKVVLTDNNITQLYAIQQTELSLNVGNTALGALNETFAVGNGFLAVGDAVKRGVFVINPGLKAMKADALGIDVKIRTEGVPDIRWRDEAAVARAGGMGGAAGEAKAAAGMMTVLKTDAGGVARAEFAAGGDGAVVVAYAVDGTSLMAADVLVIPSKAKLRVMAVVPDEVTPGQEFEMPVVVTNLSGETMAATAATVMTGGMASQVEIPAIERGRTVVVRAHATCPLAWEGGAGGAGWGAVAGVGRSQRPVTVTLGRVEWRGVLRTRTLKVPVVVPVGGIFGQGEHVLTLPAGEGAVGVRIVKAVDLASFPGASLDAAGELNDASEPQHPSSALLHVLAARAGATDETVRRALDGRMALLAAELAVTESEGGWSWENIGISPGLLTTAFTWRALLEAKAAGIVVSDMMLKRTAAFVAGRYRGIGATDFERKATTLQSLAAAGQADFSVLNPLYRARETLTPVALSRLCAAFIHAGREDEAKEVLVQLLKTGTAGKTAAGEETLFWPGAKTVAGLNAPEEATAAALWCVARLNPAAPEARRIAMWLINAAASAPGGTTRCRGQVMQALAEYAKALPRAAAGDRVEVLSGGQAVEVMPGMLLPMPADGRLVIRVSGAAPAVVIAAVEREVAPDDPKTWEYPKIGGRLYLHNNFVTDGIRLGAAGSSPVTQAAYGQLVHVVVKVSNHPDPTWQSHGNFLQIDEEIPAGCLLVEGSLRHNADRVERTGNRLRLRYGPGTIQDISYDVIALMPGVWPVRAAEIADPYDPARCRRGVAGSLTVLAPGVASPDAYQMNRAEHLELARLRFAQNKGAECLGHLDALAGGKLSQDEERDMARMRLWILADAADGDARAMIGAFELLSERHPRLVIPFDKLLKVGPAYRKLGEFERAATVFRAALDGAFLEDAGLAVVLEDNGDFAGSVAFQEVLWSRYPDSRDVMDSLSGLAQSLSTRAPEAEKLPVRRGQPKLEKVGLLGRSLGLLQRYATLYPEDEQADDVAFSLVNVHFALKDYPGMVAAATAGAERHAGGGFADSFKYMAALGYFWQGAFDKALAAAAPVANGESKDRDYARYVTAQVHHAQGQPAQAIEWYSKVKGVYEDAAEAIALFEEKRVTLPEVTVFKPGEPVKLTLDYRNIREGAVQLYKVDLMKLYLREKSLSSITRVNLAGIAPEAGESFALGDGKDFAVKQKVLTLPVKEEGAYLAIVRGDNLFTSGLVLVSALKLEVKENNSGTVRVTVTDAAGGKAVSDADVKALGSQSMVVQSGSTDPRGVFETGGIAGTATVIVKQGDSRYAFHRGNTVIGGEFDPPQIPQNFGGDAPARNNAGLEQRASGKPKVMSKGDYLKNIDDSNKALQKQQIDNWEGKRRSNAKGVEASEALKK